MPAPAPDHYPVNFRRAATQDNFPTLPSPIFVPASRYPSLPALSSYYSTDGVYKGKYKYGLQISTNDLIFTINTPKALEEIIHG